MQCARHDPMRRPVPLAANADAPPVRHRGHDREQMNAAPGPVALAIRPAVVDKLNSRP